MPTINLKEICAAGFMWIKTNFYSSFFKKNNRYRCSLLNIVLGSLLLYYLQPVITKLHFKL